MNDINRRVFAIIVVLITLLGTAGLLYYSITNISGTEAKKPGPTQNAPTYRTTIAGQGEAALNGPLNLAASDSFLYVASSSDGRLVVYTKTGTFKYRFDLEQAGRPGGEPFVPLSVAVDEKRRVYVAAAHAAGNAILVFDKGGRYLYRFPEEAGGTSSYIAPGKALALHAAKDRLYVTDIVDHDIKVYALDGGLVTKFGRPGAAKGEFLYPNGIAVDGDGKIFVSDSNNSRVQVFDEKGEFLFLFEQPKDEPLALPRGIAFDERNRVHIVDTLKHKIFVFTHEGKPLYSYGKLGNGSGGLSYPNGIAIDTATGKIYVADKMNNRVSVWE